MIGVTETDGAIIEESGFVRYRKMLLRVNTVEKTLSISDQHSIMMEINVDDKVIKVLEQLKEVKE